jgi:hypothetical protein
MKHQHQEVTMMQVSATCSATDKKAGRQQIFVCLILLPIVLFTLSGFTVIPNTAQTSSIATEMAIPRAMQMSEMLTFSATDISCSDSIILDQISWSGIRIYFNECALEHLTALVASVGTGGTAIALISSLCPDCAPIAAGIAALVAGVTSGIDFLQWASQGCGGAFLDISWSGVQFESACPTQDNGS